MDNNQGDEEKSFVLSGNIILGGIVVLSFVIVLMVTLHLYARWYLLRARRRQNHLRHMRQQQRRVHIVFYDDLIDIEAPSGTGVALASAATRGLDASILKSLPVFVYSSKTHPEPIDCAVCLSEFEDNETGRVMPKCKHSFHIDCIDMWFHSHSTCPLCRSTVEPTEIHLETVIDVDNPETNEPGSSSGLCSECQHETASDEGNSAASSSSLPNADSRKASAFVGITVDIPRRSIGMSEGESDRFHSPPIQRSFRSPMSRMFSFKRMLSRDRRENNTSLSPSSADLVDSNSVTESLSARVETH